MDPSARCKLVRKREGIFRDKGDGTKVTYYIFPEYEIHKNTIEPGTVQQWHHHERIIETLFVVNGSLRALWVENGVRFSADLDSGDLIDVGNAVHTFANVTGEAAEFVVFRLVPDGCDKREIIKNDRHADTEPAE